MNDNEQKSIKEINKSLYFIIFKLISKLDYYSDLLKNEFLKDEKIEHIQLFLIFNHKPMEFEEFNRIY